MAGLSGHWRGRRRRNSPRNASRPARQPSAAERLAARSSLPAARLALDWAACADTSASTEARSGRARSIGRNCVSEPPVGRQAADVLLTDNPIAVRISRPAVERRAGSRYADQLTRVVDRGATGVPPGSHGIGIDPGGAVDSLLEQEPADDADRVGQRTAADGGKPEDMDSLAEIDGIRASQRQNRQVQRFRIEWRPPLI